MSQTRPLYKPFLDHHTALHPIDWSRQFQRKAFLEVEIGFGLGEVLIKRAKEFPKRNYVGIEGNAGRIEQTLRAMALLPAIGNVRILNIDARVAFQRLFALRSIDSVYSLFPCPWPKKRHIKHRLFSKDFLQLINSRLKKKGQLYVVTDHQPFADWIVNESSGAGFRLDVKKITPRFATKFERKWQESGQSEFYELNFIKEEHKSVPLEKDIPLKSFKLKSFSAAQFKFENLTGKKGMIFKDFIYDDKKHQGMSHVIVVETNLTQHLWVEVRQEKKNWIIEKAPGQAVFSTPGVLRALEMIYRAALKTTQ